MYQVLSENPDIVVLDDPISSFDKNKKFAILYELFNGKASLKGRTTIMLTHDIEPVIDAIKSTAKVFQGSHPIATFLTSRNGNVTEKPIRSEDIKTFAAICKENIERLTDPVLKLIYLRRHYEIIAERGLEYNLLASLFKGRENPTVQSANTQVKMTAEEKSTARKNIGEWISDFDYDTLIQEINNKEAMKEKYHASRVGYEKIQLFRIIGGKHVDHVITKFVNKSYHIENEYLMQLNPHNFESVPEYIIAKCDDLLKQMGPSA